MSADFTPGLSPYKETGTFRFWCQKVLPLVYDDSLSYYELLCKVVNYLNDVISNVDVIRTDTEALHEAYIQLQNYVNDYFDNLDVQNEINNKLDEMAEDGSFTTLIDPLIPPAVSDWLGDNLTPTSPPVDVTLTISGAAADAKKTGDEITKENNERLQEDTNLKDAIENKINAIKNIVAIEATPVEYEWVTNKVISASGIISNASGDFYKISDYIPIKAGQVISCKYSRARWMNQNWAFYDSDKNVISTYGKTVSGTSIEYAQKIIAPYGSAYFVLARDEYNIIATEPNSDVTIITKYSESVNNVPKSAIHEHTIDKLTETALIGTDESSKVIGNDALIVSVQSEDFKVSTFTVKYGDIINIRNCQSRYNNKMYVFYDASGLPINYQTRIDNNIHNFMLLDVPFGAITLSVSGYQSYATVSIVTSITDKGSWAGKKWACIGDSLTDDNNTRATKRYFDYIHDETEIAIINLGKSGTGYMKEYHDNLPFYQRINTIPVDSDVITIFGSGNDCSLTLGTPTDTGTDTVCGCINTTIDGIRSRIVGANIGIISPTPWQQYPTYTENNMGNYCEALEQICKLKGVPFLNLYRCSNMLPWEQSFREAYYTRDDGNGTHPDENGHKFFAPHIKAFLSSLLM